MNADYIQNIAKPLTKPSDWAVSPTVCCPIFTHHCHCLSNALHRLLICFLSVRVFVNRSVVGRLGPQFFTDFTKFCTRLRNVVGSTPIVYEMKQK